VRASPQHFRTGTLRLREGTVTENTEQMRLLRHSEGNSSKGRINLEETGPPG